MRLLLKTFYLIIVLIAIVIISFIFMAVSNTAAVSEAETLDHQSLITLKKTLTTNNPFKPQNIKREQTISLSESNLNHAVLLGLQQKKLHLPTKITLKKNLAEIANSVKIPKTALFLNIKTGITTKNQQLYLRNISIGQLPIPIFILDQLNPFAFQLAEKYFPELIIALQSIEKVNIDTDKLTVSYRWNQQLTNKLRSAARNLILPDNERERVKIYYQQLAKMNILNTWRNFNMSQLFNPIFSLAKQQTQISKDPVGENRAAIIALGLAISGVQPKYIFQENIRHAYLYRLTLLNRRDLAKHFLISGTLSVFTNKAFSDAVGLSKEIDDSRGGTGFSFPDLLADRAGVKFAELATKNAQTARYVQQVLANPRLTESDFMPAYTNLPEAITELQFKQKYVDISHPNYLFVENEINNRINLSTLHKKQS